MWNADLPSSPAPPVTTQERSPFVVDSFTVKTPWVSQVTPCPVKNANRDGWTEEERQKAEDRVVADSLEHLQQLVRGYRFVLRLY